MVAVAVGLICPLRRAAHHTAVQGFVAASCPVYVEPYLSSWEISEPSVSALGATLLLTNFLGLLATTGQYA